MGKLVPKIILITLFLSLFLGLVSNQPNRIVNTSIRSTTSTNPGNPVILTADVSSNEYFPTSSVSYYYKTAVITSNYGVIWLRTIDDLDNHDLYVYTDSSYSVLLDSSTLAAGSLEWVVIKRGGESDYYPRVYVNTASIGGAYIEYDTALVCGRGEAKSNDHLSNTDIMELYYIYLDSTKTYDFQLTVPATGDFELYLYYLETSITADPTEYLNKSTTTGLGTDEAITNYAPPQSGTYVVLIVWASGDGTFSFIYDYAGSIGGGIPGFELIYLLAGLVMVSIVRICLRLKNDLR